MRRFKTQPRLLVSLVLVIILFAVTAGLTKIETDDWQSSFMTLTLVTVVLINLNAAIFQGTYQLEFNLRQVPFL